MEIIQTAVYTFDELSDRAKEKARDWWREGALNYDWWEFVFEDVSKLAMLFGLEICARPAKRSNGDKPYEASIFFSGFSSQGDGACFEGGYFYEPGALAKVKAYAPLDAELHRIVKALQDTQRKAFYKLSASIRHRGRCYHSGCMDINVWHSDNCDVQRWEDDIAQAMRDFADWIYRQLKREYEYQMSDEQVDEAIRANQYTFTEDGQRFG